VHCAPICASRRRFLEDVINARPYSFLDDAPLEERRVQAVRNRRWLDAAQAQELGILDRSGDPGGA
jgi:hypothetical protein